LDIAHNENLSKPAPLKKPVVSRRALQHVKDFAFTGHVNALFFWNRDWPIDCPLVFAVLLLLAKFILSLGRPGGGGKEGRFPTRLQP
jgi:hypothetical protein